MPHWPARLLVKLFAQPSVAIGGTAPTAQAFLPGDHDAPSILVARLTARAQKSVASRRAVRGPTVRRRLAS
jgi:hypothetical protein